MVYWHTTYKKHHSWLIRKTRGWNFFFLFLGFYSVYWYNRTEAQRTLKYLDRIHPSQERANAERRLWGYRTHYEPLIARSRKNLLLAQGDYEMRLPWEDQFKADEVLENEGYKL